MNPPTPWRALLKRTLRGAQSVVILGIGNSQKGDDGAGTACAERIAAALTDVQRRRIEAIPAGEVPENYTGTIRRFKPSHVVIIDACSAQKAPGSIFLVESSAIADADVSTHRMPLSMLVRYLEETVECRVVVIGIEPLSMSRQNGLSAPVESNVERLARFLSSCFEQKAFPFE